MRRLFSVTCFGAVALCTLATPAAAATPLCFGQQATDVGTPGDDVLQGTSQRDVIVGLGGDDTISGGRGNDLICGNGGGDTLVGGRGDDKLHGGSGTDSVSYATAPMGVSVDLRILSAQNTGGAGWDVIRSAETVQGSTFGDTLRGGAKSEIFLGLAGNDTLAGGAGDVDLLLGGPGDDALNGGGGVLDTAVYFTATSGVTASLETGLASGEGADTLTGLEGLVGSQFADDLAGGATFSLLFGWLGDDTLRGSPTTRALAAYLLSTEPIVADLAAGVAQGEGNDTLVDITGVIGSDYDDELTGSAAPEMLVGWAGSDTISGGDGGDSLLGFDGADSLFGGPGEDTLAGGSGGDRLVGDEGQDLAAFAQSATGVSVDLAAGQANEGGDDTIETVESVVGSAFDDTIAGNELANRLLGASGDDTISGREGADELDGGAGVDALDGGLGSDVCIAGETTAACESTAPPGSVLTTGRIETVGKLGSTAGGMTDRAAGLAPPRTYSRPSWRPSRSTRDTAAAATVIGRVGTWSVPQSPTCDGSGIRTFAPEITPAYQGAGNPYPTQLVWFHPWYWDPGLAKWVEGGWYYTWGRDAVSGSGQVLSLYDPYFGFSHFYLDLQTPFVSWFNENSFPLSGWDYYGIQYLGTHYVWFQIIWMPNSSWPYRGEIGSYVTLDVRDELDFNIGYAWGCTVS